MELHPFLEKDTSPNSGLWYVMSAFGDCPSMRVGHTCSYIPSNDGANGQIFVVGGANPSGPFAETYVLDLETFSWDSVEATGLRARYEHAAFVPASMPTKLFVFGGADQSGNHNDMQVFDIDTKKWSTITANGNVPTPRTYHNHISVGDKFVVYSGGQCGSDPVGDRQVHAFDANTLAWTTLNVRGDAPKPRHGHLVLGKDDKIYIHGGMSGTHFYEDLHVLDLEKKSWSCVKKKKGVPCARAAHGGVVLDDAIYIFGGMNRDGALDDMWKLCLDTLKWSRVDIEGPAPACRLDFGMCVIKLKVPLYSNESVDDIVGNSLQAREVIGTQLRMGSGGSVRSNGSIGSAGSHRSVKSLGSGSGSIVDATPGDLPFTPTRSGRSPTHSRSSSRSSSQSSVNSDYLGALAASGVPQELEAGAAGTNPTYEGPTKTVDMLVVVGGMDTQGEVFDDCLMFLLRDHGPDELAAQGGVGDHIVGEEEEGGSKVNGEEQCQATASSNGDR